MKPKKVSLTRVIYIVGGILLGFMLLLAAGLGQAAPMNTFTVNTTSDTDDGACDETHCSLREAVNAANALSGDDTIAFSLPPSSTIVLVSGQLPVISDALTIDGSSAVNLVIEGADCPVYGRIFAIGNGTAVTINYLTLTKGFTIFYNEPGGAIYNNGGTLTVLRSTFVANFSSLDEGGAIYSEGGMLNISSSKFISNGALYRGGAIASTGTMIIDYSTFEDNRSRGGGGIWNGGNTTISNSEFNNNEVHATYGSFPVANGGAIYNSGTMMISYSAFDSNLATVPSGFGAARGGAIDNSGILTLANSTLSGNSAFVGQFSAISKSSNNGASDVIGGGIANGSSGDVTIINSTISGNSAVIEDFGTATGGGVANFYTDSIMSINNSTISENSAVSIGTGSIGVGGLENNGVLQLSNTIIANSIGSGDCQNNNTINPNVNNLIEDGSCGAAVNGDPLLGSLLYNGGLTPTHALLPGSPAIDNGDNASCEPKDQRSVPRPIDGDGNGTAVCDIGSVEVGEYFTLMPVILKASG
jgi:CSLREA domain-containing protein